MTIVIEILLDITPVAAVQEWGGGYRMNRWYCDVITNLQSINRLCLFQGKNKKIMLCNIVLTVVGGGTMLVLVSRGRLLHRLSPRYIVCSPSSCIDCQSGISHSYVACKIMMVYGCFVPSPPPSLPSISDKYFDYTGKG